MGGTAALHAKGQADAVQLQGAATFMAPAELPLRSTCSGASESRNRRISPHMPPCLPGAPRMMASASLTTCAAPLHAVKSTASVHLAALEGRNAWTATS